MSKYNLLKADFSGGEISPKAEANPDNEEVKNGVSLLENFTVYKSGGASKRVGTEYISTITAPEVFTDVNDVTKKERRFLSLSYHISKTTGLTIYLPMGPNPTAVVNSTNSNITATLFNPEPIPESLDTHGFKYRQKSDVLVITHVSGDMEPLIIYPSGGGVNSYILGMDKYLNPHVNVSTLKEVLRFPYLDPNTDGQKVFRPSVTTGSGTVYAELGGGGANFQMLRVTDLYKTIKITHSGVTGSFRLTDFPTVKFTAVGANVDYANDKIDLGGSFPAGISDGNRLLFKTKPTADFILDTLYYVTFFFDGGIETMKLSTSLENKTHGQYVTLVSGADTTIEYFNVDGTSPSEASMTVNSFNPLGAASGTDNWEDCAWSMTRGWPKDMSFYEGRSVWIGTHKDTDGLWASVTGNIYHMMQRKFGQDGTSDVSLNNYYGPLSATDALSFAIAGSETPITQWISVGQVIQVGTLGQEFIISGGGSAMSALPGSISVKSHTAHGGSDVNTIRSGRSVIYTSKDGQNLRSYKYNEANGSYTARDLSRFSDELVMSHGGNGGTGYTSAVVTQTVYQPSTNVVWAVTSNNKLLSMTYDEEEDTGAWARHTFGGTDAKVISILTVPSGKSTLDELWVTVERTVNGSSVIFIERMRSKFENIVLTGGDALNKDDAPFFSDASTFTVAGSPTDTFTFPYLANETLTVLADGLYVGEFVADGSGQITLDADATKVIAGLKYKGRITSMNLSGSGDFGTPEGNKQRPDRVYMRVLRSYGGKIGDSFDNLEDIEYEFVSNNEMFTGGIRHLFSGDPDEINRYYIEHDEPVPFNILSVTVRGVNYD